MMGLNFQNGKAQLAQKLMHLELSHGCMSSVMNCMRKSDRLRESMPHCRYPLKGFLKLDNLCSLANQTEITRDEGKSGTFYI